MVAGLRTVQTSQLVVDPTAEQTLEIGLPAGGEYQVIGILCDGHGQEVSIPEVEPLVVPARWLYPQTLRRDTSHRDITGRSFFQP
jgi:hypothetical protein